MASLTRLKQDIQFNARLGSLLNVMKSIATQQFQMLDSRLTANPPFFDAIQLIAGTFDLEHCKHPFTEGGGPVGVIAVTSDQGLLGGLNQQVVAAALREYRKQPGELIVIGKRGLSYAKEHGYKCREFPGVEDERRLELAYEVRDYALNRVLEGRFKSLVIAYPKALSFTLQRVETIHALPCQGWLQGADVARGVRGGGILLESSVEAIIEYLVWTWLGGKLYEVFGSARLAELSARSVHLEGSTQELQRRRHKLMRKYFRERKEIIDRSMRELFAARSLYREGAEAPMEEPR
jgi:F-type H+-transporting ATPase subunit gamma